MGNTKREAKNNLEEEREYWGFIKPECPRENK